jgi:hypothetical protein
MMTKEEINQDLVDAVCKLVEAVLVEHCLPVGGEGHLNEEFTVECALAVLEVFRTAPEFSSLHGWVDLIGSSPTRTCRRRSGQMSPAGAEIHGRRSHETPDKGSGLRA